MKQLKLLLFIAFGFYSINAFAQKSIGIKAVNINGEKSIDVNRIESLAYAVLNSATDQHKDSLNAELKELLKLELNKSIAFAHSFEKIESISILTPPDSSFRIFNWNVPYADGTYRYECALLKPKEKLRFIQNEEDSLMDNSWIPALYYAIIEKETKFQTYYTLLGWKGNDRLTTKKVIDCWWFNNVGKIKFGAPIFQTKTEKRNRIIFEYAAQNVMGLNYNPKFDRIELDHLSPPKQSLTGIYEYYGPDLSFDAYQWEKNHWILDEDIDLDQGLKKKKADFKPNEDILLEEKPIYQPK